MTPTDTPQNACPHCGAEESRIKFSLRTLQTLVMSLTDRSEKAEAEVAKLNHQLLKAENDLLQSQDINSFLDTEFRIACKRAERAEAKTERLKEQLESTQNLCLKFWSVLEEHGFELEINQ